MSQPYYTIKTDDSYELIIKKSRFICHLKRVESEKEAQDFIHQIKKTHYKATHNCSAFILRTNPITKRSSDDGEPSGTAGMPMLEVLSRQNLTNVVAVTTRYFGGVKLGAGGLIRAYSSSVSEALKKIGIVIGEAYEELILTLQYSQQGNFDYFLEKNPQYFLKDTNYLADVTFKVMVKKEEVPLFKEEITNLFNGQFQLKENGESFFERPYQKEATT